MNIKLNKTASLVVLFTLLVGCASLSGQGNTVVLTDRAKPQLIKRVQPKYPKSAAKSGVQGWVKMSFDISKDGKPVNIVVIESMPNQVFDKAATDALSQWFYQPKVVNGQPLETKNYSMRLDFNLGRSN
ncbi:TonB family protein [Catenovulum agarivorans DS-2]|uniref:Protein TonB n=1 Tax=Catenovulum agarivorans DS-2 TaxID=1328313 RepID=W7QHS1_9ALTE|nr:energy transducer TonB [Catenovulum agarivorans]EWH11426.1 TonB family protein [Catenovulum agarivorans DS-2]